MDFRLQLRRILNRAGYSVLEASDGETALRKLQEAQVDLVITDIVMPGQEGIQTIRLLKSDHPGLQIIAVSGVERGSDYLKFASRFGAKATLLKPIQTQELLAVVRNLLS